MKYILFDLDGTITESGTGIINSVKYALEKMNIPPLEESTLKKFIGPPLIQSMMKYAGMNEKEAQEGLRLYRVYFEEKGIFENVVYTGVEELLKELSKKNMKTAIATSKPEKYAKMITEHFGLDRYLCGVYGATMNEKMVEKSEIIKYAMEGIGIHEREYNEVIMVGDRMHDIYGAKQNNIKSIGVLYGYGDIQELNRAGADYIAVHPADILDIINKITIV